MFLDIITEYAIDISPPEDLISIEDFAELPFLQDNRYSLLSSQYDEGADSRIWAMRLPNGKVIGYHIRYPSKKFENVGRRGLGYVGKSLASVNVLRVVEGAYDVVLNDSVCVFGKITRHSLYPLRHYPLCVCPDSDVMYN
jgi:hypothetical protein